MSSVPDRDDPRFGLVPLPDQVTEIRPAQWDATQEAVESYQAGNDVVFLEGPTGSGKSLVGDLVTRELARVNGGLTANMVCTTKALQEQYAESFPYAKVIMGKSNYATMLGNVNEMAVPWNKSWSAITCADCTWDNATEECRWCSDRNFCPYGIAKNRARYAQVAILNTAYYLTDSMFAGAFRGRGLTILDEADLVEREILSRTEIVISPRRMKEMLLLPPKRKTAGPDGKGAVEWASWIRNIAIPSVENHLARIVKPWSPNAGPAEIKEYKGCVELRERLYSIVADVALGGWVYDGIEDGAVIFRPVRVEKYGSQILWPTAKRFLVMSATILSADLMNDHLGGYLPYTSIVMPSTFPAKNRPIYVCPVADMSNSEKEASNRGNWRKMVGGIRKVLERHPDERVLVHTVSYDLARFVKDELKLSPSAPTEFSRRPIIIYTSSDEKAGALAEYKRTPGAVMIAASMDRGIDLPDEMCRVMVVAKVPFLNLKDKRTNAMLHSTGGGSWYRMEAIRTLIQMTGRGVRHENDKAETYILDAQFTDNLWKKSDFLFPKYWRDAIDWRKTTRWLMGAR